MSTLAAVQKALDAAVAAGLCAIPPRQDGSKQPWLNWKPYQSRRPTASELAAWYAGGRRTGLGLVTGPISGGLECLEFDVAAVVDAFIAQAAAAGLAGLVARLRAGYEERSPSGGIHWLHRCTEISGNMVLARRPTTEHERRHPDDRVKTTIETRGIGGYIVVAPSHGRVHPSGRPYELITGGFATIATITPEERAALFAVARAFDQPITTETPRPRPVGGATPRSPGPLPGDDFNLRGDWERDVLTPAGWAFAYACGERLYYRRPGKAIGVSGDVLGDVLYVFTSSTPLEAGKGYSRFGAFTALFYGGDWRAAAADLGQRGYGRPVIVAPPAAGGRPVITRRGEEIRCATTP